MYLISKELYIFLKAQQKGQRDLLQKSDSPSPIPKTHIVERKNQLPQIVMWPPQTH